MGLATKAIVLDEEKYNQLPTGERSRIIRDLISNYLAYKSGDIQHIDEEILLRKERTLETKKMQIDTELESIKATLNMIKEDRDQAEAKKLVDEKEKIAALKKCLMCGRVLEEGNKIHTFTKGIVCQVCFMSATPKDFKVWSGKDD